MELWGQWMGTITNSHSVPPHVQRVILNIDKDSPQTAKVAFYPLEGYGYNYSGVWLNAQFASVTSIPVQVTLVHDQGQASTMVIDTNASNNNSQNLRGIVKGKTFGLDGCSFDLQRFENETPTDPDLSLSSWEEFKDWLLAECNTGHIFRGQTDCTKRLMTSFHRTHRRDLVRYSLTEVRELNRYLSGILDQSFSLVDGRIDEGALLNLAQHHGFPTPLLDWTESPYIAAFFAFNDVSMDKTGENVRIFSFNRDSWDCFPANEQLWTGVVPFLSVDQLMPLQNARALPQQSIVTTTNVSNIEDWLKSKETSERRYLTKVDLPASERGKVMKELRWMGISAASLFPGVEGTCRALRERFF